MFSPWISSDGKTNNKIELLIQRDFQFFGKLIGIERAE
jgi:hypothetical protein